MKPILHIITLFIISTSLQAQIVVLPTMQAVQYRRSPVDFTFSVNNTHNVNDYIQASVTITSTENITARGVCWSDATTQPDISLSTKTTSGSGSGSFSTFLSSLVAAKIYYVRAFATVSSSTTYYSKAETFVIYNYTGGMQSFTIPADITSVVIDASGAMGGTANGLNGNTYPGGPGARMRGKFIVNASEKLDMLIGGRGTSRPSCTAGGGGGTFVTVTRNSTLTPLLIAGGGGGGHQCGSWTGQNGGSGQAGQTGGSGTVIVSGTFAAAPGGTNGFGGTGYNGGGGGGWKSNGSGRGTSEAIGGYAYPGSAVGSGGYGGGGSSFSGCCGASGGGGGYSGGGSDGLGPANNGGGTSGGGGGSYYDSGATDLITTTGGGQVTDGKVLIILNK